MVPRNDSTASDRAPSGSERFRDEAVERESQDTAKVSVTELKMMLQS